MAPNRGRASGFEFFGANPDLLRPLGDPTRMRIYLASLNEPVSAKELAALLELPIQRISYHVRNLVDAGLLTPVRHTRRRGALETHYEGIADLDVDDETLRRLPAEAQQGWFVAAVKAMAGDTVDALEEGAHAEDDLFLSRAHFKTTAAGRRRLFDEVIAIYERLGELQAELAKEAAESDEPVQELNVVLCEYKGQRRPGRNGPQLLMWDREGEPLLQLIPNEYL